MLSNTAAQCGEACILEPMDRIGAAKGDELYFIDPPRWYSASYRATHPDVIARTSEMLRKTNPEGFAACCAAIRDMDQRPDVGRIRVPTLVVFGQHDQGHTALAARFLIESIPRAEELELPAAHLSCVEAEERFHKRRGRFPAQARCLMPQKPFSRGWTKNCVPRPR